MKIAYQGIEGSYSEAALLKQFGKKVKAIGYETFEDVFEALKKGKADLAFLPFENTIIGSIAVNYDLLLREDAYIIKEVLFKIKHNLLSNKGSTLKDIKTVYSHPKALEQCRDFLRKHKLKAVPVYDTAGAAKLVKQRNKKYEAAIAPELCSKIYSLNLLKRDIAKTKLNITKFFVLVKKRNIPKKLKKQKTTIAFRTKHHPGALISCLQSLSNYKINMTKLESRPLPKNPWEYVFYIDFIGNIDSKDVKKSLRDMQEHSTFIKVLGSYPKGKV